MEFSKGYIFVTHIHMKKRNDRKNFAKVSKNLARSENNFVGPSK